MTHIGVELPLLLLLELEHGRRVWFTSDIVRRRRVRAETRVIDLIRRRCVLDLVKRRAQLTDQIKVAHQIGAVRHSCSPPQQHAAVQQGGHEPPTPAETGQARDARHARRIPVCGALAITLGGQRRHALFRHAMVVVSSLP
jgi:hypothetical protein